MLRLAADAATSSNRLSSDRDASKVQLMASMSSVGGADSLQDIWAMMESGLSPRIPSPRRPNTESMCNTCFCVIATFSHLLLLNTGQHITKYRLGAIQLSATY